MFNPLNNTMQQPFAPVRNSAGALALPEILEAYKNDPRAAMAIAMMKQGMSTAPVAAGKWGITDGIARALQAPLGAYIEKKTRRKYGKDQDAAIADIQAANEVAKALNPAVQQPNPTAAPPVAPMAPLQPQQAPAPPQIPVQAQAAPMPPGGPPAPTPQAMAAALTGAPVAAATAFACIDAGMAPRFSIRSQPDSSFLTVARARRPTRSVFSKPAPIEGATPEKRAVR